jgi:hypothetical protein
MSKHHTPLEVCELLIGKPDIIAAICGVNEKAPFGWRHAADRRGGGDIPYTAHQRALLDYSEANGLGLTAVHLIRGASADEVAEILAARGVAPRFVSRREVAA